jgi:hypothetical protein
MALLEAARDQQQMARVGPAAQRQHAAAPALRHRRWNEIAHQIHYVAQSY